MDMDARKRLNLRGLLGGRGKTTNEHTVARKDIAKMYHLSENVVRKYLCFAKLIPELMALVDEKKILETIAEDLSYLDKEDQRSVYAFIESDGMISIAQAKALHKCKDELDEDRIFEICTTVQEQDSISAKPLKNYIPTSITGSKQTYIETSVRTYGVLREKFPNIKDKDFPVFLEKLCDRYLEKTKHAQSL